MNRARLKRLSIVLSVIAWLIFAAICLVPMREGGFAAIACMVMVLVFTGIIAVDILGTLSLDRPRMGCLSILYFVVWSLVLAVHAPLFLTAPFMLQGDAAKTPWWGKLGFSLAFAIPAGFGLAKILIGAALRRDANGIQDDARAKAK